MFPNNTKSGYSAEVHIRLHLEQGTLRVAQLGPDFIILPDKTAVAFPPCKGTIELDVDDDIQRWEVYFPAGIQAGGQRIPLQVVPESVTV